MENKTPINNILEQVQDLYKTIDSIGNLFVNFKLNNFIPFNIKNVKEYIKEDTKDLIKINNILIEYNIDENISNFLYGDEENIKFCIFHLIKKLIKNSLVNNKIIVNINKYSNDYDLEYEHLVISIIDNNISIPKNIKNNLFKNYNSSSIELYICKKIIDLHHGIISYNELKDIGNEFFIILKLKKYNTFIT